MERTGRHDPGILRLLVDTRQTAAAFEWVDATQDDGWRTYFLRMLGVYAGEAGLSGVLAEVLKRIRKSKTPDVKALALAEIAAVIARSGDKRRARQVLKEADRSAEAADAALRIRIAENEATRFRIMVRRAEVHATAAGWMRPGKRGGRWRPACKRRSCCWT